MAEEVDKLRFKRAVVDHPCWSELNLTCKLERVLDQI